MTFIVLKSEYNHEDYEHRKTKEIEEELEIINDKFRDLGYFWILKKKEKFEKLLDVEPPKDHFDSEDEDIIKDNLILKEKAKRYILNKEKLRIEEEEGKKRLLELNQVEESESESSSESEDEEKEQKEIVEIWYLRIEKNF